MFTFFSYPPSGDEKLPHNQNHVAQIKSVALSGDQIVWNLLHRQFSDVARCGGPDVIDKVDSYLIFSYYSLHTPSERERCVSSKRRIFLLFRTNQQEMPSRCQHLAESTPTTCLEIILFPSERQICHRLA